MNKFKTIFSFFKFPLIIAGVVTFLYWLFMLKAEMSGVYLSGKVEALTVIFFTFLTIVLSFELVVFVICSLWFKKPQKKENLHWKTKSFSQMSREEYEAYSLNIVKSTGGGRM